MANERKTERIVRKHFEAYEEELLIEEQKSDNPIIQKLLKTASKKGTGSGYPEFLITPKNNSELLIVIECKSEVKKHESKNKNKYTDYAVDGVLLYASYLSKEYDVLAIAVSGENKREIKISHFLCLKGTKSQVEIFGNKFLTPSDYINGYLKSPEKYRQDYTSLLQFTKELNDSLHSHKILESQRSLLISCILIALESKSFKLAYPHFGSVNETDSEEEKKEKIANSAKDLADYLVDTVVTQLKSAKIKGDKLENLKVQFSFIKTDTSLSTKHDVLKNLIKSIDLNVNSFIKTHKYIDVLGQLYIEFLRYANSDKGLGIVLTPPHITEFFAEVAQVNKNSIAFDNCTGTGGFLISAMKKMIENAKGDEDKIKNIKKNQLFGVEYQSHIFALAVSNMFIHQDGKTNIINGNCFDDKVIKEVKAKNPTVGFLNPPYKADKKNDTDELEFILNNLSCLSDGATCIAIVPMSCALSQKGKTYEWKKKLLERHTLEAVFSMPDELFTNSNVNVISCAMVFSAHKVHPANKETFFGYYKIDGFEKRKNLGRTDLFNLWGDIKEKWLSHFFNKKNEPGFSVTRKITADDEWCAEAYMETDYTNISEDDFIKQIKSYITFKELF